LVNNNLNEIMNKEALSNSELARLAGLTDKTVGKVRKNQANGSRTTQNKIIVGLNKNPVKVGKEDYTWDSIFRDVEASTH